MAVIFLDPVKQVRSADIHNTLVFRGDLETGNNCKVHPTFAGKQKKDKNKQNNFPQRSEVYDRIQLNLINQVQQDLALASPQELHALSIEWPWKP